MVWHLEESLLTVSCVTSFIKASNSRTFFWAKSFWWSKRRFVNWSLQWCSVNVSSTLWEVHPPWQKASRWWGFLIIYYITSKSYFNFCNYITISTATLLILIVWFSITMQQNVWLHLKKLISYCKMTHASSHSCTHKRK